MATRKTSAPKVDPAKLVREQYAAKIEVGFSALEPMLLAGLTDLSAAIARWNELQGFWDSDNTGEKIALMHSELSEALEADRHGTQSDKIPGFTGVEEELADTLIRILDFAGHHELRLTEAVFAKLHYNLTRPMKHGKAY